LLTSGGSRGFVTTSPSGVAVARRRRKTGSRMPYTLPWTDELGKPSPAAPALLECPPMRKIRLQYGTGGLDLTIDAPNVTLVEPRFVPGLADEAAAFREALRNPIHARPLRDL